MTEANPTSRDADTAGGRGCAWCDGALPAPVETFSVVCGSDGEMLLACSVSCLAALVQAPAARTGQLGLDDDDLTGWPG